MWGETEEISIVCWIAFVTKIFLLDIDPFEPELFQHYDVDVNFC